MAVHKSRLVHLGRTSVDDVMHAVAADVAELPSVAIREMVPVLRQAEAELAQGLHHWLTEVPNGADRFTAQQYRNALVQVRNALRAARGLGAEMYRGLKLAEQRAGTLATFHVQQELTLFAHVFGDSVRPIPIPAAAVIAEGKKTLLNRMRTSSARYAGNVQADIRRELAVGLVKGETIDQLKLRLVKLGGPRGEVALRGILGEPGAASEHIAEGLFRRYGYWAERVARTEVLNAYNEHAEDRIVAVAKLDPETLQKRNEAGDRRTCSICRDIDGEIAKPGGDWPSGYGTTAHPNCRGVSVAWRSDWKD